MKIQEFRELEREILELLQSISIMSDLKFEAYVMHKDSKEYLVKNQGIIRELFHRLLEARNTPVDLFDGAGPTKPKITKVSEEDIWIAMHPLHLRNTFYSTYQNEMEFRVLRISQLLQLANLFDTEESEPTGLKIEKIRFTGNTNYLGKILYELYEQGLFDTQKTKLARAIAAIILDKDGKDINPERIVEYLKAKGLSKKQYLPPDSAVE